MTISQQRITPDRSTIANLIHLEPYSYLDSAPTTPKPESKLTAVTTRQAAKARDQTRQTIPPSNLEQPLQSQQLQRKRKQPTSTAYTENINDSPPITLESSITTQTNPIEQKNIFKKPKDTGDFKQPTQTESSSGRRDLEKTTIISKDFIYNPKRDARHIKIIAKKHDKKVEKYTPVTLTLTDQPITSELQNLPHDPQTDLFTLDQHLAIIDTKLSLENFKQWQTSDPTTKTIIENIQKYDTDHQIHKVWTLKNDLLYINNEYLQKMGTRKKKKLRSFSIRKTLSLYVPGTTINNIPIRYAVMRWAHGLPISGHLGITGTYRIIRQSFFWKGMINDIKHWIKHCHPCQRRKTSKKHRQGLHKSVLQTRPFETVSVDLVGKFPKSNGFKYILTIIDHFTRYPIAIPIPSKKAHIVAQALKTHLFCQFPYWPRKIVSDKGGEFVNKALKYVYDHLGVKQILTSHDNPKANQVERFHRYLSTAIAVFIRDKSRETLWPQYLDTAVYMYRCSVNNSTGYSPFYALYGTHPQNPLEIILNMEEEKFSSKSEHTNTILQSFKDAYVEIYNNQLNMAIHNAKKNLNRQDISFEPGQLVWAWRKYAPHKLENRYNGPYKIHSKVNDNSYLITLHEREDGIKETKKVSITHLHPYDPHDDNIFDTSPQFIYDTDETDIWKSPPIHTPDTFCIVPAYAYHEIEEMKLPFVAGKILSSSRTDLTIQLFLNTSKDPTGELCPGFVDIGTNQRASRTYYKTKPKQKSDIPYTNHMLHKHFKFDYELHETLRYPHTRISTNNAKNDP